MRLPKILVLTSASHGALPPATARTQGSPALRCAAPQRCGHVAGRATRKALLGLCCHHVRAPPWTLQCAEGYVGGCSHARTHALSPAPYTRTRVRTYSQIANVLSTPAMRARAQPAMELCEQVAHSRAHFAGFPHGWEWWTLVCVCAVVMSLTAEYLCMQAPPPPLHAHRTHSTCRTRTHSMDTNACTRF